MKYKFIFQDGTQIDTLFNSPKIGETLYYCGDTVRRYHCCTCDYEYKKGFGVISEMNDDTVWLEDK